MDRKEDVRVTKTKLALNKAFSELLAKKALEDISVNELCLTAGVRRATFYKHYVDKLDFCKEYIGYLRIKHDTKEDTVSHLDDTVSYYVNYAKKVIEYINENEIMVNNLLKSSQLHIIIGLITERNFKDTLAKLQSNVNRGMILPASTESCAAMLTGGVATTIFQWLMSGREKSSEQLTEEVSIFIRNVLRTE